MTFNPDQLRGTPKNKGSWAANDNGNPEATLGTSGAAANPETSLRNGDLALANKLARIEANTAFLDSAVGYSFRAENYLPEDIVGEVNGSYSAQCDLLPEPVKEFGTPGEYLAHLAEAFDVDVAVGYSYDSDDFPKPFFEDQVSVHEHALLGREYWSFDDGEAFTGDDALASWDQYLDDSGRAVLWDGVDQQAAADDQAAAITANAVKSGIDLDAAGIPLPVRHN